MRDTKNKIVEASELPLSIIIVGVGNGNFENMVELDADNTVLVNQQGKKAIRDVVQFVPFNKFKGNPELLAKDVLGELPDQLVSYMQIIGVKPNPPIPFDENMMLQSIAQAPAIMQIENEELKALNIEFK